MRTVLIIDDNPGVREALALLLSLHDIRALSAADPAEGLALLEREAADLVIQDMNFSADTTSGEEGRVLFQRLRQRHPDLPVILLTAWTQLEQAVALVKAGAADYLAKPWDDLKLLATVENLLELAESNEALSQTRRQRRQRVEALRQRYALGDIVFASDAMISTLEMACQVARAPLPVLVTGPNGSGKERIARLLHANSAVAQGPLVALNCGALPADLIEAELFGAESGAFTGAGKAREGRFEAADGGTLFLDEIGNLPLAGQMKLLRVLETGQFERLGSTRTRTTRVRVVSATNADLPAMVAAGSFREDLFYRLNVIELRLAPLAERRDDILPLAEQALAEHERQAGQAVRLSEAARSALLAHAWPGNVRELRNALARAALLCREGLIQPADLGLAAAASLAPAALAHRNLDEPSREAVLAALQSAQGVVARAAQQLGLSRQALYRRMDRYGLPREGGL
ncbi:sigma-54-dependent Fis family transcriptional regulator [Mitsuaria sp. WAJ17]|uniref:sigma-54-dependent transcriptional regulator n=1 Tax=Mitsuaria sp. WAJ17 TaxID=2761452 RepID=UPI0015FECDAC|nr:sigma-54 dependent transcriptional regulator [Mitsuaria sp. WAJ17]MBB2483648.1 sigma-54-dependent Fis family transcriptional regulator [Mitsuaria sp. WAJ17]